MKVERELMGFTFPFVFGVGVSVMTEPRFIFPVEILPCLAIVTAVLPLLFLAHDSKTDAWSRSVLVFISAFGCGSFTGLIGSEMQISDLPAGGWLGSAAMEMGSRMEAAIDRIPFKDYGTNALMKALLTGEKGDLDRDVIQAFRDSGASHILALSGLHLGIIYKTISKTLSIAGNALTLKRIRSILIIAACGFYTIMTGAGASISRAFLFILLREIASMSGRSHSTGTILLSAITLQLTFSPSSVKDIGFQLSYSAMAGIAFILPWLNSFWTEHETGKGMAGFLGKGLRWIWNSAAMSIACQITTGPLAYYYFGTFPQHFLLTNLIAIPLTGLIIPAGLICLALSLAGYCPSFLLTATEWLATAMTDSLHLIATM